MSLSFDMAYMAVTGEPPLTGPTERGCNDWGSGSGDSRFWVFLLHCEDYEKHCEVELIGPWPDGGPELRSTHWFHWEMESQSLAETLGLYEEPYAEAFLRENGLAPGQAFQLEASYWSNQSYEGEWDAGVDWELISIEWWTRERHDEAWATWERQKVLEADDKWPEIPTHTDLEPCPEDPLPRFLDSHVRDTLEAAGLKTLGDLRDRRQDNPQALTRFLGDDEVAYLDRILARMVIHADEGDQGDDLFG